jgi:Multiubiquitin
MFDISNIVVQYAGTNARRSIVTDAIQHVTKFILNMEEIEVHQKHLNYQQFAKLAYPKDPDHADDTTYTITVSYPDGRERSVARGDRPVEVVKGMVVNVRKAGRS